MTVRSTQNPFGTAIPQANSGGGADPNLTYVTEVDETADLPNSFRLVAGANVALNNSTPNQLIVSASGGGGGGNLTPDQVAELYSWYDASQLVGFVNNDPVGTFTDLAGGRNLVQATGGAKPLYKTNIINSLPILRFDGSDDNMRGTGFVLSEFCVMVVCKMVSCNIIYEHSDDTNSNPGSFVYGGSSMFRVNRNGTLSEAIVSIGVWDDGRPIFDLIEHHFSQGSHIIFRNGMMIANRLGPVGSTPGNVTTTSQPFNLCSRAGTGLFSSGDIAEVAIFTPYPGSIQVQGLRAGFASKYGIVC